MLDAEWVINSLQMLRRVHAKTFGANAHHFILNNPASETEVSAFESQHKIVLPRDYRHFLTAIGNGGAGPFYGVFPLGVMDDGSGLGPWNEHDGIVGDLAQPFPLTDKWNDLSGKPADDLQALDDAEYEEEMEKFEARYWGPFWVNGAIPICHLGCALRIWLVVMDEQAGKLWYDARAEYGGLTPMTVEDGSPLVFDKWYLDWLNQALREAQLKD